MPEKPQYVPITLALQKEEAGGAGTQGHSWLHLQLHSMLRSQPGIRLYKEKKHNLSIHAAITSLARQYFIN